MIVDHEHKWMFLHVPKAAGSYVCRALGREHDVRSHFITENIDDYPDYFRFMFVRSPLARFVSNYRYARRVATEASEASERFDRRLIREHRLDLEDFVKVFTARSDPFMQLIHYVPQWEFARKFRPHFVGRVESVHEDLTVLCRLLGRTYEPGSVVNASLGPQETLSPYARLKIASFYRTDVMRFGYFDDLKAEAGAA